MLDGDLAAGKTTFVSQVVELLGGDSKQVTSPTFSLHHVYRLGELTIDHMDLYRLENDHDLESSGFFEVVEEQDHLGFIEWSSRIGNDFFENLNRDVFLIRIEVRESERRELNLTQLSSAKHS